MLSDDGILRALKSGDQLQIEPKGEDWLQPAGVDLRLSPLHKIRMGRKWMLAEGSGVFLRPGDCVLGMTVERVMLGRSLAGQLTGKSSVGRLFVEVHKTAGHIDPGFDGTITLEIHNSSRDTVVLPAGEKIAQILFHELSTPCLQAYGHHKLRSNYQSQIEPRESHLEGWVLTS